MPQQIIRLPEVIKTTGLAKSTIYKLIAENRFPKQIRLTEKSAGWIKQEVSDWVNDRIAASRTGDVA
jgi:prophage regulatory protein